MDLLGSMRAFVRVYETGSFSASAKQLSLSQPSVSKTIAQLERSLEAQLFLRSTRGLAPTDAGKRFYAHSLKVLDEAELAIRSVAREETALVGRLRVGGTITLMRQHIIPHVGDFLRRHPDLTIDFLLSDGNVGLIEEGVEISFRAGKLVDSGLTAKRVGRTRRIALATPEYLDRSGRPSTPDELLAHSTIVFSRSEGGEVLAFERAGLVREVTLKPVIRSNAMEGLRAATLSSLGIGVGTEWIFDRELANGTLEEVLGDWLLPPLDLWAILPAGRNAGAKVRAFLSFFEERMNATGFGVHGKA